MMSEFENITLSDNTVSAIGQMRNSTLVYYLGNPDAKRRILIVGNSITRHGPDEHIGWFGDYGMSASKEENDYVHRLARKLNDAFIMVRQLSAWERGYVDGSFSDSLEEERAFCADEIIFNLGENVCPLKSEEEKAKFKGAIESLLSLMNPKNAKIYFCTCFWESGSVDGVIREVAKERNMPVVELGEFGKDKKYMAIGLFEHRGVAIHPGDLGMEAIADRLFQTMRG